MFFATDETNYRRFSDYEKPLSKEQPTSKGKCLSYKIKNKIKTLYFHCEVFSLSSLFSDTNFYKFFNKDENEADRNSNSNNEDRKTDENDDIMLGIIVGAGVVIALVSSAFLLHRRIVHKRKRVEVVKYDYPSRPPVQDAGENTYDEIRPSYRSNTMTRMTSYSEYPTQSGDPRGRYFTMVVSPDHRQGCYGDARSSLGNRVSCTPPVVRGGRRAGHSPPSYSECYLDNGGSVVAVWLEVEEIGWSGYDVTNSAISTWWGRNWKKDTIELEDRWNANTGWLFVQICILYIYICN